MKVLFAVSNEETSEAIVKKYQRQYKQIISYKNVYYFNAILKELQKDKTYDRIVISEELEAFTHTQYDQIDKFIFEKLDGISDEATNNSGDDIPIILICSDRREKSEEMLTKLFGIGIYNAIIGNDRSVEEVCRLINRPRGKKEAKDYYQIESNEVNYQSESENDVSEVEVQNILAHYKRLGKNEDKYVESFDNIASQYNDVQLKIISRYLPLNVRAVLEERSPKYQQLMSFGGVKSVSDQTAKRKNVRSSQPTSVPRGPSEKLLDLKNDEIMSGPVIIPTSVNMSGAKKLSRKKPVVQKQYEQYEENTNDAESNLYTDNVTQESYKPIDDQPEEVVKPVKRGRGRPRKNPLPVEEEQPPVKRRRGRPRKNPLPVEEETIPKKEEVSPVTQQTSDDTDYGYMENSVLPGIEENNSQENNSLAQGPMPSYDMYEENNQYNNSTPYLNNTSSEFNSGNDYVANPILPGISKSSTISNQSSMSGDISEPIEKIDLSNLLTSGRKIATFVGTSKNGTSFIVNNLAEMLSTAGVDVAVLDTTQNKNSYYIYTKNDEEIRTIAEQSIHNLRMGVTRGIDVHRNLTIYTSLPDSNADIQYADQVLEALLKKHTLILVDADFNTPLRYFEQAQELYLVQSLDILTIQPLTAFLRDLKAKNILDDRKLKIILNKKVKIKGITDKTIIGGMAFYNDPAMSFMTELFDRTLVNYISIPFEEETYVKYLENIIECNISLKGYSKIFLQALKELGNMVYPVGQSTYRQPTSNGYNSQNTFNPGMTQTLNQMKNNY